MRQLTMVILGLLLCSGAFAGASKAQPSECGNEQPNNTIAVTARLDGKAIEIKKTGKYHDSGVAKAGETLQWVLCDGTDLEIKEVRLSTVADLNALAEAALLAHSAKTTVDAIEKAQKVAQSQADFLGALRTLTPESDLFDQPPNQANSWTATVASTAPDIKGSWLLKFTITICQSGEPENCDYWDPHIYIHAGPDT